MNSLRFAIELPEHADRIDKVLNDLCVDLSRTRIKALIESGNVLVNDEVCESASRKIRPGDVIEIDIPAPEVAEPMAENIPLDIVYEDKDLVVINKQAGLVVHPGAGNYTGTLVNALLYHCGAELSGIGGVMRPGIVHRLDKETSGLMVVAKNDVAHRGLAAQLESRTLSRVYKALTFGVPFPPKGFIEQPIARHANHRLKMSIARGQGGRYAKTNYIVEQKFKDACALVECRLETGRTHQIRVHMEFLKHPLIGDQLYGPQPSALRAALKRSGYGEEAVEAVLAFPRQALHAQGMGFIHPVSQEEMFFEIPLAGDLSKLLKLL